MFAVTGITGQVGLARLRALAGYRPVRSRRHARRRQGRRLEGAGCEIALADIKDAAALTAAFSGRTGVFVDSADIRPDAGLSEIRAIIAAVMTAIGAAKPSKVVCLSTIGAQATQPNLLNQLGLLEKALGALPSPVCFLRAAWFMENAAWDVAPARDTAWCQLPAAARQARANGRDGRHRPLSGYASARDMDGPP